MYFVLIKNYINSASFLLYSIVLFVNFAKKEILLKSVTKLAKTQGPSEKENFMPLIFPMCEFFYFYL